MYGGDYYQHRKIVDLITSILLRKNGKKRQEAIRFLHTTAATCPKKSFMPPTFCPTA